MAIFLERWEQPELHDCDVNGHDYEQVEILHGYSGTMEWQCTICEEIYGGEG